MKLHLPRLLAAALLAAVVSAPVYAFPLDSPQELVSGKINGEVTYQLYDANYTYNRTEAKDPFISGATGRDSLLFTSATGENVGVLSFAGGNTQAFYEINNLSFTNLKRLKFSSMSSGAIYSERIGSGFGTSLTISGIKDNTEENDVYFTYNSITGNCGGAINADSTAIRIEGNGGVIFEGNHAYAGTVSSGEQNQESTSTGGGVGVATNQGYTISLFGYKLSFEFGFNLGFKYESGNDDPATPEVEQMDICGGAINLFGSTLSLSGNQAVTFKSNSALDYGGAISASPDDTVQISSTTGQVLFQENKTTGHVQNNHVVGGGGGAIFIGFRGKLEMDRNEGDILFVKNEAAAAGGAIYFGGQSPTNDDSSIALTNNKGNIRFEGNLTGGTGGAIHMQENGRLEIAGNEGNICFDKNQAGVSGGAISALNAFVSIENNKKQVSFTDNLIFHQQVNDADSFTHYYVGAAIYGTNIQIHNNESVIFQRNAEKVADDFFRLRSLYVEGTSDKLGVSLSAGEKQSIKFHDSIYIKAPQLQLNANYRPSDAEADIRQTGDIIFTGATTEEDLVRVKTDWVANNWTDGSVPKTATADEIKESRTSIVLGETQVYGGRLRVEDEAIFKSAGIKLHDGSAATLQLKDAKIVNIDSAGKTSGVGGTAISVATGTTLEVLGHSAIEGGQLTFADGANWSFDLNKTHQSWQTNPAALTFDGQLNINGSLTLYVNLSDSDMAHRYALYAGTSASYDKIRDLWTAENIIVEGAGDAAGAGFDDLVWEGSTLYYVSTMVWNNAQQTGDWDFDDKNWENGKTFSQGMNVRFTNTGAGTVNLSEVLDPDSVMVSNGSEHDYIFTGKTGGKLSGESDLVKRGDGELTLDLANDYTGSTKLEGGTLNLHDDKALGDSTLTTAEGTTLSVGDGAQVALDEKKQDIKGNVIVKDGAGLEISGGSYTAPETTVDGTLTFKGKIEGWNDGVDGTLKGSGLLEVTDNGYVRFAEHASGYTGNVNVGSGSSVFLKLFDSIVNAGKVAVDGGKLVLEAGKEIEMAGTTVLSSVAGAVAEKVTKVVTDQVLKLAEDAILAAVLKSMMGDVDGDGILNEGIGANIESAGLILNGGSTLTLDHCHINLVGNNNSLTLNVTKEDYEADKLINLELILDGVADNGSMVLLFSDVDMVNLIQHGKFTLREGGEYIFDANRYFSGDMVGKQTQLVCKGGNVYITGLVVPEPTTATLSLLALAALAARRRRC